MRLFFVQLLVFLGDDHFLFIGTYAVQIGSIVNASLNGSPMVRVNGTCEACICAMLHPSSNEKILSLNCNAFSRTCELFLNYSSATTYQIRAVENATLYFRQLPWLSYNTLPPVVETSSTATTVLDTTASILKPLSKKRLFMSHKFIHFQSHYYSFKHASDFFHFS